MKRALLLFYGILNLSALGSPDYWAINLYRDMVAKNLRFLDEGGFPSEPGSVYPWLTVLFEGRKAVLLCPEDGFGEAILIFSDGSMKRKNATGDGKKLSYYTTIKPHDGKRWEELNLGAGWKDLRIDDKKVRARSASVAQFFADSFYKAAHTRRGRDKTGADR